MLFDHYLPKRGNLPLPQSMLASTLARRLMHAAGGLLVVDLLCSQES